MKISRWMNLVLVVSVVMVLGALTAVETQSQRQQEPQVVSPEVSEEREVTFRILAPKAETVILVSSDLPNDEEGRKLSKNEEGVWELTVGPVEPGAYRYHFNVDEVPVIDPHNPKTSESNMNTWSLVYVPGADFMDTKKVPHGAVSMVTYYSSSLERFRRMHIYTPPGYESGEGKFPIFYLLHGAFDCDNAWSTVGRAGFILDNLIAEKKAKPMVVVMPDGHTGPFRSGSRLPMNDFIEDFNHDIKPYVEKHYRVYTDRKHRAIAGLSMGGAHTLNIAIPNLREYGYVGVFSSGIFGITRNEGERDSGSSWEEEHKEILESEEEKEGLRLFWFATGKDDFLIETSRATVEMFKKHDFEVTYKETSGGHTWKNWREYLQAFAAFLY